MHVFDLLLLLTNLTTNAVNTKFQYTIVTKFLKKKIEDWKKLIFFSMRNPLFVKIETFS